MPTKRIRLSWRHITDVSCRLRLSPVPEMRDATQTTLSCNLVSIKARSKLGGNLRLCPRWLACANLHNLKDITGLGCTEASFGWHILSPVQGTAENGKKYVSRKDGYVSSTSETRVRWSGRPSNYILKKERTITMWAASNNAPAGNFCHRSLITQQLLSCFLSFSLCVYF